jgi:hypothetical protein
MRTGLRRRLAAAGLAAALAITLTTALGGCAVVTVTSAAVSVAGTAVGAGVTLGRVAVGTVGTVASGTASVLGAGSSD